MAGSAGDGGADMVLVVSLSTLIANGKLSTFWLPPDSLGLMRSSPIGGLHQSTIRLPNHEREDTSGCFVDSLDFGACSPFSGNNGGAWIQHGEHGALGIYYSTGQQ